MLINYTELLRCMPVLYVKLFSQRDYRNDHLFTSVIKDAGWENIRTSFGSFPHMRPSKTITNVSRFHRKTQNYSEIL